MSLNYSLYTNEELTNIPEPKNNQNSNKKNIEKIKQLLQGDNDDSPLSSVENNSLADFVPLSYPETNIEKKRKNKKKEKIDYSANDISIEQESQLESQLDVNNRGADYYKQYIPQHHKAYEHNSVVHTQSVGGNKDELMEKLNYMIHLLEEQQDEKTANITEELILYTFLGVFVIFVVDSFAKAGKYVR